MRKAHVVVTKEILSGVPIYTISYASVYAGDKEEVVYADVSNVEESRIHELAKNHLIFLKEHNCPSEDLKDVEDLLSNPNLPEMAKGCCYMMYLYGLLQEECGAYAAAEYCFALASADYYVSRVKLVEDYDYDFPILFED